MKKSSMRNWVKRKCSTSRTRRRSGNQQKSEKRADGSVAMNGKTMAADVLQTGSREKNQHKKGRAREQIHPKLETKRGRNKRIPR